MVVLVKWEVLVVKWEVLVVWYGVAAFWSCGERYCNGESGCGANEI